MNQIPDDAWDETTWEGNRRAQLRLALGFTLRERMQALEDVAEIAERFRQMRETGKSSAAEPERDAASEPRAVRQSPGRYESGSE